MSPGAPSATSEPTRFCPLCDARLDAEICPTDHVSTVRLERHPTEPDDAAVGRVVGGRYRLERKVGEGAVGRVYAATQLSLGREVAIKLLHPRHVADRTQVRRFYGEARAATRLTSRHIVKVLDFGVDDDSGSPWIALELLSGETLERWLARAGPLRPRDAARVFAQVARALVDAAGQGIVHRDLKPSNVMRVETGDGAELFAVTDFGVAKDLLAAPGETLTAQGVAVGTPAYMAPEQVTGERVDARADVYALGCMLFEALTGRRPFGSDERASVMSAHLLTAAPPLPDPLPSGERAPPELAALVARMLAKAPSDRPRDAREVLTTLERVASRAPAPAPAPAPVPVPAPPPPLAHEGVLRRLWSWIGRRPLSPEEKLRRTARARFRRWRLHKRLYLSVMAGLVAINLVVSMMDGELIPWSLIPAAAWGIVLMMHGLGYKSWLEDNAPALAAAGIAPEPARPALTSTRTTRPPSIWPALLERCRRAVTTAEQSLRDVDTRSGGGSDARAQLRAGLADIERIARGGARLEAALAETTAARGEDDELAAVEASLAATRDPRLRAAYEKNRELLVARRERVELLQAEHARLRATVEGFALAAENIRLDAARIRAPRVEPGALSLDEPLRRLDAEVEVLAEVEAELARLDADLS
ncbi:MAG: protein kinase [Deltaproteobacteria bacterium]|nr:protein kinase [Deltaproteobacteria bacterium]